MSKNTADIKSRKKQFSPKGSQPTRSQDDEDEDESFQEKVKKWKNLTRPNWYWQDRPVYRNLAIDAVSIQETLQSKILDDLKMIQHVESGLQAFNMWEENNKASNHDNEPVADTETKSSQEDTLDECLRIKRELKSRIHAKQPLLAGYIINRPTEGNRIHAETPKQDRAHELKRIESTPCIHSNHDTFTLVSDEAKIVDAIQSNDMQATDTNTIPTSKPSSRLLFLRKYNSLRLQQSAPGIEDKGDKLDTISPTNHVVADKIIQRPQHVPLKIDNPIKLIPNVFDGPIYPKDIDKIAVDYTVLDNPRFRPTKGSNADEKSHVDILGQKIFEKQKQWQDRKQAKLMSLRQNRDVLVQNELSGKPDIAKAQNSWNQAKVQHDKAMRFQQQAEKPAIIEAIEQVPAIKREKSVKRKKIRKKRQEISPVDQSNTEEISLEDRYNNYLRGFGAKYHQEEDEIPDDLVYHGQRTENVYDDDVEIDGRISLEMKEKMSFTESLRRTVARYASYDNESDDNGETMIQMKICDANTLLTSFFDVSSTEERGKHVLHDPKLFIADSMRVKKDDVYDGVSFLIGRNRSTEEEMLITVMFDKLIFSESSAHMWWLENHNTMDSIINS